MLILYFQGLEYEVHEDSTVLWRLIVNIREPRMYEPKKSAESIYQKSTHTVYILFSRKRNLSFCLNRANKLDSIDTPWEIFVGWKTRGGQGHDRKTWKCLSTIKVGLSIGNLSFNLHCHNRTLKYRKVRFRLKTHCRYFKDEGGPNEAAEKHYTLLRCTPQESDWPIGPL